VIPGILGAITKIWRTDSELREKSLFGESRMDEESRRSVALICGGAAILVLVVGFFALV
jgi:hypothetical protein